MPSLKWQCCGLTRAKAIQIKIIWFESYCSPFLGNLTQNNGLDLRLDALGSHILCVKKQAELVVSISTVGED